MPPIISQNMLLEVKVQKVYKYKKPVFKMGSNDTQDLNSEFLSACLSELLLNSPSSFLHSPQRGRGLGFLRGGFYG